MKKSLRDSYMRCLLYYLIYHCAFNPSCRVSVRTGLTTWTLGECGGALTVVQELNTRFKWLIISVFCQQLIHLSISYTKTCKIACYSFTHCTVCSHCQKIQPTLHSLSLSLSLCHTHTITTACHLTTLLTLAEWIQTGQKKPFSIMPNKHLSHSRHYKVN